MEEGDNLLDTLFDDESVENGQDVEMLDVEEGELIEQISKTEVGESCDDGRNQVVNQESNRRNSRHKKKKKKKNKRKGGSSSGPDVTNINSFERSYQRVMDDMKSS